MSCVQSVALETDRPFFPLKLQALIQLPRLANESGVVSCREAIELLEKLALELPPRPNWQRGGNITSPRDLVFRSVSKEETDEITEKYHYLRSPRQRSEGFGLFTSDGILVALAVSSPLDVSNIAGLLKGSGRTGPPRVISRVFVFETAPRNTISYLLAKTRFHEKSSGTSDLVTYVNPNMGFTGVSYKASGWHVLGYEGGTRYKYLDDRYATDRQLLARVGTDDANVLRRMIGDRFSVSVMQLMPLVIFHTPLGQSTA